MKDLDDQPINKKQKTGKVPKLSGKNAPRTTSEDRNVTNTQDKNNNATVMGQSSKAINAGVPVVGTAKILIESIRKKNSNAKQKSSTDNCKQQQTGSQESTQNILDQSDGVLLDVNPSDDEYHDEVQNDESVQNFSDHSEEFTDVSSSSELENSTDESLENDEGSDHGRDEAGPSQT